MGIGLCLVLALAALVTVSSAVVGAQGADWPSYQHDDRNVGGGMAPGPGANVTVVWRRGFGGRSVSSPVVADGTAYVGTHDGRYGTRLPSIDNGGLEEAAATNGSLRAIGVADGGEHWTRDIVGGVWAPPVVEGDTVYAGTFAGEVYALDRDDGTVRWRYDVGAPVYALAARDDTLVVATRDFDAHSLSHSSYPVVALDRDDGGVRWSTRFEEGVYAPPAIAGGTVFVGGQNGSLRALGVATGDARWNLSTRAVDDVPTPGAVTDIEDPLYRQAGLTGAPTVVNDTVYAADYAGRLYAVDRDDGTVQWQRTTRERTATSPAVVDGTVLLGTYRGRLYAVAAGDGELRWEREDLGPITKSSPVVGDGVLIVGIRDGAVSGFDAATGGRLWNVSVEPPVRAAAALTGRRAVAAGRNELVGIAAAETVGVGHGGPTIHGSFEGPNDDGTVTTDAGAPSRDRSREPPGAQGREDELPPGLVPLMGVAMAVLVIAGAVAIRR